MNKTQGKTIFIKSKVIRMLKIQLAFLITIVYMELVFALATSRGLTLKSLWMLVFFPSVTLFFASLCGSGNKSADRIVRSVLLFLVSAFYASHLIYFKIFGSLWSFSMVKMGGNAMENFKDAIYLAIGDNIFTLILLFVPFVLSVFLRRLKFASKADWENTQGKNRICVITFTFAGLAFSVLLWFLGALVLKFGGTGNNSVYYVYSSTLCDTDTTANYFGAFSTTLIEMKSLTFSSEKNNVSETIETTIGNIDDIYSGLDLFDMSALSPKNDIASENPGNSETDSERITGGVQESSDNSSGNGQNKENGPDNGGQNSDGNGSETANEDINTTQDKNSGFWAFDIDFDLIANNTDSDDVKQLCQYFQNVTPSSKNEYTGLFEGYNLIYICAESFWTYAVNEYLTPTLYKMMNNGIILNNYYGSFLNTTTNGEFAMATGLWPDVGREGTLNGSDVGSFPSSSDKYMPYGLGNLFKNEGVNSYAFHNYRGSYYSRNKSWPNLGYTCKFMTHKKETIGGMIFSSTWITSDYEMMQQSVDDYINEERFHAYYMTFSGHGPYNEKNDNATRNMEEAKRINNEYGLGYNDEALAYIAANMELDKAMEYVIDRLSEKGICDKTVIVLAADHYPYYVQGVKGRKALTGQEIGNDDVERYKSTCMIYNSGMSEPIVNDEFCCNVDILPTILNLFNIAFDSRLLSGRDVFADNVIHKAVLYNKSFLTEYVTYNTQTGTEWHIDTEKFGEEKMAKYLSSMSSLIESEYAVALKIMECDFYRYVEEYFEP